MRHNITIKDLIYFGAVSEAYKMETAKLTWVWKFACGCAGSLENPTHKYDECPFQDNLFWSDRFVELGRTIKMPLQQDEVQELKCKVSVAEIESDKLRALIDEATELLGDVGMEYYDIFMRRIHFERNNARMSVLEEHSFYTQTKDWYINNQMTPLQFEEIKINMSMKYLAKKILEGLEQKEEAVIEAVWTPNITEQEELLFAEHVVQINESDHVTSPTTDIKAADE